MVSPVTTFPDWRALVNKQDGTAFHTVTERPPVPGPVYDGAAGVRVAADGPHTGELVGQVWTGTPPPPPSLFCYYYCCVHFVLRAMRPMGKLP